MPKQKYNKSRAHNINKSRVSISDIEKRSVVLLLIVMLLMFAFTPLIIVYKKKGTPKTAPTTTNTIDSTDVLSSQTTIDTINSTISSSNSDILTTPSVKSCVDSLGKNISSYVGGKIESTVNKGFDDLSHVKLPL